MSIVFAAGIFIEFVRSSAVKGLHTGMMHLKPYRTMILPQMTGAMGSCITILAMYALRSFDLIYSLTSYTNPASATLPIMMYNEMYAHDNYAYAAAISCFLLAMVLILTPVNR